MSAWAPGRRVPRSRSPNSDGRGGGHQAHGLLEPEQLPAAQAVGQERGRVRGAAHPVEVRAGVGTTDQHPVVLPDLGPQLPRVGVVVGRRRPEHRAEVVRDHDVEERVERLHAALGRDVADRPAAQALVLRRVGVADHVAAPPGEPAHDAGLRRSARAGPSRPAPPGRGASRCARRRGARGSRASPGGGTSAQKLDEPHVHADERRHRERDDPTALRRGTCRRLELVLRVAPLARVDREHVPVERPARGGRHLRHEVHLGVVEAVEAAVGDELECRARVLAHDLAQREHLVGLRVPRRDGLAVAVGVRVGARRREAQPARLDRLVQQRAHLVELLGGRRPADGLRPHDPAPERAVPDEEPRVHAEGAVEAVEVLAEGAASPTRSPARARRGACPRPAPSSGAGSRRPPGRWGPA